MAVSPLRLLFLAALASVPLVASPRPARAGEKLPGEAADLTDAVRAQTKTHLDALFAAKDADVAKKERRALLVLGPVVWPVIENAARLLPPEASKPHLNYLKALLLKKTEPEWEYLRARLRVVAVLGNLDNFRAEMLAFRIGRPDPAKTGSKIPPTCKAVMQGTTQVWRSGDGTIVLAFGPDGNDKNADAPDVDMSDSAAGFVGGVGGTPKPLARHSGRGGAVNVSAPMGFAFAYASNGADGLRPGGEGGEGGTFDAKGGAGEYGRAGNAGAGAPG